MNRATSEQPSLSFSNLPESYRQGTLFGYDLGLRVAEATRVLAEKFGVEPLEFTAVDVLRGVAVIYSATYGLKRGSLKEIRDPATENDYLVNLMGQKVDTRSAMTRELYDRFARNTRRNARASNEKPMPDSRRRGVGTRSTLLTGDFSTKVLRYGFAAKSYVTPKTKDNDAPATRVFSIRETDSRDQLRFRPSLILP